MALLVMSTGVSVLEYRRLSWFENEFGTYKELRAVQVQKDKYAELRKYPVVIYIKEETPEDEILNFLQSLSGSTDIELIEYVSKDRAREVFFSQHGYPNIAYDNISYNNGDSGPFRASLIVLVKELSQRETIAAFIKTRDLRSIIDEMEIP